MGCIVDKRKPIITNRCSIRTTMVTGVESNVHGTCKTNGKKWMNSSTVKNTLKNEGNKDEGVVNNTCSMKMSNGESECNCVIHEAPNTMDSFKLMNVITELEKGEKLRKERSGCGKENWLNWEDSNMNTVSNTRMNSEREGYGNNKQKKHN